MTPVTVYDVGPMGDTKCPECREPVYIAWDDEMNRIALEPDEAGTVAVSLDGNRLPWCRDVRDELPFDQQLYQLHAPQCPGLATVTPIGRARSRRRVPAPRRPESARRTASAR